MEPYTALASGRSRNFNPLMRSPGPADASGSALTWGRLLADGQLSSSEVQLLDRLAQRREVAAGEAVYSRDRAASHLVALWRGEAALGLRGPDGHFHVDRVLHGPAWLDWSAAWAGEAPVRDAQAMGPVQTMELPRSALAGELLVHPRLAQRLIEGLAREVQSLAAHTHALTHKDAPARLAEWLCQRCEPEEGAAADSNQAVVRLNERKRDVASQLAITPETLSRLMRSFNRQGVIEVSGYLVRVLDLAALGRLAKS